MAIKDEEEEIKLFLNDAIENGDIHAVKKLVKQINHLNFREEDYLFLHTACYSENKEMFDLLLDHGAKHDLEDSNGEIPLHIVCSGESYEIAEMLLKRGSIDLINKRNKIGRTPLHFACMYGNKKVVEVLLKYGASLTLPNKWGNTPLNYAKGSVDIFDLVNKEEERRRNVGNVGCHLLRASRAIFGFGDIPPEIKRVVLSFFDEDSVLTDQQVKDVIHFGFDCNNSVPDKQQFISQMKLEF